MTKIVNLLTKKCQKNINRNVRLLSYLNELAMRKGELNKATIISTTDSFKITITAYTEKNFLGNIYKDTPVNFFLDAYRFSLHSDLFGLLMNTKFDINNIIARMVQDELYNDHVYGWDISFTDSKGKFSISPKEHGVSLQLFAGLEEAIKIFNEKHKPEILSYSSFAGEKSKVKLYKLLARKIEKKGFELYEFDYSDMHYWIFVKKKLDDRIKELIEIYKGKVK